jgi:hypothetical protein
VISNEQQFDDLSQIVSELSQDRLGARRSGFGVPRKANKSIIKTASSLL